MASPVYPRPRLRLNAYLTLPVTIGRLKISFTYCRDVIFHEDACDLALGHAAQTIALLNNLVLGLLRVRGFTAIASARRRFNAFPAEALALVLYALT